ncbi:MAG: hypothetical protein FJX54_24540, partial [Alphaproteobacteria bacterium]|nr:hypothetical protein [Alphaproteobacteria bacterium]
MATKASKTKKTARPTRAEAEDAIRVLLRWTGDDPDREGLHDTPARVCRAYEAYGAGYGADPEEILSRRSCPESFAHLIRRRLRIVGPAADRVAACSCSTWL